MSWRAEGKLDALFCPPTLDTSSITEIFNLTVYAAKLIQLPAMS